MSESVPSEYNWPNYCTMHRHLLINNLPCFTVTLLHGILFQFVVLILSNPWSKFKRIDKFHDLVFSSWFQFHRIIFHLVNGLINIVCKVTHTGEQLKAC